jgi:hypothetical protein
MGWTHLQKGREILLVAQVEQRHQGMLPIHLRCLALQGQTKQVSRLGPEVQLR